MFHQSRKKIGYNISTIFIQMNLLTQRSKTFAMIDEQRQNECHGQHSRPLDFMRGLYKLNVSCLQMASAIIDGSLKKKRER